MDLSRPLPDVQESSSVSLEAVEGRSRCPEVRVTFSGIGHCLTLTPCRYGRVSKFASFSSSVPNLRPQAVTPSTTHTNGRLCRRRFPIFYPEITHRRPGTIHAFPKLLCSGLSPRRSFVILGNFDGFIHQFRMEPTTQHLTL